MNSYTAYGLGVRSTLAFPELVEVERPADVTIRLGEVERRPSEEDSLGACFRATATEVGLFWADVGAFLVRNGNQVIIDAAPGIEESVLRLFTLGPIMALVLHQRGFLILHASAVAIDGAAVAFLGGSGWGKSTTAAALHNRGHGMFTDDVLALEPSEAGTPVAYPGFPQIKLWPEAAESLGDVPEMLARLHPEFEKRGRRDPASFRQDPAPLRCIYVLAEGDSLEIEPLDRQEAFVELVRHSYAVRLLEATGAAPTHVQQCAAVVRTVPIRRLQVRRSLEALPDLASLVEEDAARD